MARGVNKVILIGNLGQDPEVKYMPNGNAVANISVATTEAWKDKNSGEKVEKTEWHRIVFFNRLAEIVGEYLKKGSKVYIEGKLQTRKWQHKDGYDVYTTEIVANDMQMMDSRSTGGGQGHSGGQSYQNQPSQNNQNANQGSSNPPPAQFDDDIPFMQPETLLV